MSKKSIIIQDFSGGTGTNEKKWTPNSGRFIKNLNIFEDPSYVTLSKATAKVSGSTVTDLVKWISDGSPHDTNRYFYGSDGNLYKETSGGTWSVQRSGATIANGAAGQGLAVFDDYLYYATSTTLGRLGKLSGTPAHADDFLSDGTTNLDQSLDTSGNTYALTTGINEGATHRQTFTPTKDPLKSIQVLVATKGSGDWTLTVHDANNVSIGSATIANASVTGSADNTFTFTTALRVVTGNAYHFHLTSTVADGTVTTTTASDLETVDFHTYFGILIADTEWHQIIEHLNGLVILNERYLAFWDQATFDPNKLTFPPGFKAHTAAKQDEFLVIDCFRGESVTEAEEARRYFWDGITTTFNYLDPVNIGAANALYTSRKRLFSINGSRGAMYIGSEMDDVSSRLPKLARGKKVEVYPGAITDWDGRVLIGVAGSTDDASGLEQGVYEYGRQDGKTQDALVLSYTVSTGTTQGTSFKVGAVRGIGSDLYIGWRDDSTYGVDKVSKTSSAVASGTYETMIFDDGDSDADLLPMNLIVKGEALASGESFTPKTKLDRAGSFTNGTTVSTVGETRAENPIYTRCKEIEFGFTLASSGGTFPKVTEVKLEYDDLSSERSDN